jgi:hypothetical protein
MNCDVNKNTCGIPCCFAQFKREKRITRVQQRVSLLHGGCENIIFFPFDPAQVYN